MDLTRRHVLGGLTLSASGLFPTHAFAGGEPPIFSWIAVDRISGHVIGSSGERMIFPPASMTKILLLDLVFDGIRLRRWGLDTLLTMSPTAHAQPPSRMGLMVGDNIRLEDAISGVCVDSHNDLAVLLGEGLYGTEARMAEAMTMRAKTLGMTSTYFGNCTGLPGGGNRSTVYDIAIALQGVVSRHAQYLPYLSMPSWSYRGRSYHNTDRLVGRVPGIYMSKTGYTRDSGFCLAAGMCHEGRDVLSVVGGMRSSYERDNWMQRLWMQAGCL